MIPRPWAGALLIAIAAVLAPAAGRAATPPGAPAYHFAAGQRAIYQVAYASTGDADFSPLLAEHRQDAATGQSPTMLAYHLAAGIRGQMGVIVLAASASDVEAWCVFRAPVVQMVINGQPQTGEAARLAAVLARGFLVDMRPDGTIVRVRMSADADATTEGAVRAFLALGQVVAPAAASDSAWLAREEDPNGAYTAQYRMDPDPAQAGAMRLVKHSLGYLAGPTAPALPGETQMRQEVTPDLDLTARLLPGGDGVAALQARETTDTAVEGTHVAHATSTLELSRAALAPLTAAQLAAARARAGALAASATAVALYQPRSSEQVETSIERSELGVTTLADLQQQLAAQDAAGAGDTPAGAQSLYLKLKAEVYLHPETAAALGAPLATGAVATPSFRLLAGALGAVGNPEAQAALASAVRARPDDWTALSAIVPALCMLPAPAGDAEATVRGLIASADPNISAMAWLCLGSMARGLAQSSPPRAQAIIDQLTGALAASSDENAKALLLQALGNAAAPQAMPAVAPYAASASPVLRAAALDAMRAIPLPEVDPPLLHALASDTDVKVRTEAAFALGFRPPDAALFAAEKAALAVDQAPQVRVALIGDLAKLAARFPEARALIQAAADSDPSEDVRQAAASLLPGLGGPAAAP